MVAHFQVSGLGNKEPATGDQVQVRAPGLSIPPSVIDSVIRSFKVPGDGPRGIGLSGIGSRLQAPAAGIQKS